MPHAHASCLALQHHTLENVSIHIFFLQDLLLLYYYYSLMSKWVVVFLLSFFISLSFMYTTLSLRYRSDCICWCPVLIATIPNQYRYCYYYYHQPSTMRIERKLIQQSLSLYKISACNANWELRAKMTMRLTIQLRHDTRCNSTFKLILPDLSDA